MLNIKQEAVMTELNPSLLTMKWMLSRSDFQLVVGGSQSGPCSFSSSPPRGPSIEMEYLPYGIYYHLKILHDSFLHFQQYALLCLLLVQYCRTFKASCLLSSKLMHWSTCDSYQYQLN